MFGGSLTDLPQGRKRLACLGPSVRTNAFRGSGPGQEDAFDDAMALVGCPNRRSTGSAVRAVRPPNLHITPRSVRSRLRRKRDGFSMAITAWAANCHEFDLLVCKTELLGGK